MDVTPLPASSKRINARQKGYRNEKKTEEWLKERGFLVETCKKAARRGQSNDFFELWDHVAVATDPFAIGAIDRYGMELPEDDTTLQSIVWCDGGTSLFIQTKTNCLPPPAYRKKLGEFPAPHKYLFIWYDRVKDPRIIKL